MRSSMQPGSPATAIVLRGFRSLAFRSDPNQAPSLPLGMPAAVGDAPQRDGAVYVSGLPAGRWNSRRVV